MITWVGEIFTRKCSISLEIGQKLNEKEYSKYGILTQPDFMYLTVL